MPTEIDPYLRTIFISEQVDLAISSGFHRRAEILPVFSQNMAALAKAYGAPSVFDTDEVAAALFSELLEHKVITEDSQRFAGKYYSVSLKRYQDFRAKFFDSDEIHKVAKRIGARFYPDVFSGYQAHLTGLEPEQIGVPASDRIVLLSDNDPGLQHIKSQTSALSAMLTTSNDVGDLTPDEAVAAAAEISALGAMLDQPSVRLSTIASYATKSLKWVAEKAAGAAVGKAAWALLVLIATFFGFMN
jgi:hypothetical protein